MKVTQTSIFEAVSVEHAIELALNEQLNPSTAVESSLSLVVNGSIGIAEVIDSDHSFIHENYFFVTEMQSGFFKVEFCSA